MGKHFEQLLDKLPVSKAPVSKAPAADGTADVAGLSLDSSEALPEDGVDERYLVPALMRGLQALQAFSAARPRLSLSELASVLGITRSSAYRLVYTLDHLGFLVYDPNSRTYALGSQVLRLGYGYLASRDLVDVGMPHLERLRDRTNWSAHLGELQGAEVVYLARVATRRSVASMVQIGTRLPAHATAMGHVLLAALSEAEIKALYPDPDLRAFTPQTPETVAALLARLRLEESKGFIVQDSGYEPGVASVAAPVRDMSGKVVAAINISAVAAIATDTELHGPLKDEVVRTAAAISHDLGFRSAANSK